MAAGAADRAPETLAEIARLLNHESNWPATRQLRITGAHDVRARPRKGNKGLRLMLDARSRGGTWLPGLRRFSQVVGLVYLALARSPGQVHCGQLRGLPPRRLPAKPTKGAWPAIEGELWTSG